MIKYIYSLLLLLISVYPIAHASDSITKNEEPALLIINQEIPDEAWRTPDPENLLYIDLEYGRIILEMYPEIAPKHVARIKELTRQNFYDYIAFHRVVEGFMNQTGDPRGDGTGGSDLPDLIGEFTFRRSELMPVSLTGLKQVGSKKIPVGFYKSLPVATQPIVQAMFTRDGMVSAYGLHCKGVTSMARSTEPNTANSQFFLMRDIADHLNAKYSIWGNTLIGHEHLTKIKVGSKNDNVSFIPDIMKKVRLASDVPYGERVNFQILKTNSIFFKNYLSKLKESEGTIPDICNIRIPTRIKQEK
ncbi:peptidylprolyl isomerase [Hellea sp.]|jgi:peptidylprolyl isomerase|nr:peptidylprolyl isomerase [Hellea sp.]